MLGLVYALPTLAEMSLLWASCSARAAGGRQSAVGAATQGLARQKECQAYKRCLKGSEGPRTRDRRSMTHPGKIETAAPRFRFVARARATPVASQACFPPQRSYRYAITCLT